MKGENEIKKMIQHIEEVIEIQISLNNHDPELYADYSGRKEALKWILGQSELKESIFVKRR